MKKVIYSIIGLVALIAVASAIYLGGSKNKDPFVSAPADELMIVADAGEEVRPIIVTQVPVDESADISSEGFPVDGPPGYGPDFSDLTLSLDTEFPTDAPVSMPSYSSNFEQGMTLDEMREIARLFGFTGDLYQEHNYYDYDFDEVEKETMSSEDGDSAENSTMPAPGEMPQGPASYAAFEGSYSLRFYGASVHYYNMAIQDQWGSMLDAERLPYNEALAIAKSYLLERDLLPDNYSDKPGYSGEVQFFEIVDGAMFNRPVAVVNLTKDGVIGSIDYMPTIVLKQVAEKELISAETAYNALLEQPGRYEFNYLPQNMGMPGSDIPTPQHWQREFAADQAVTRMAWIQLFDSTSGGAPILFADNMRVEGSAEIMAALAESGSQSVLLTGLISTESGVEVMQVQSFESAEMDGSNDVYLDGTIKLDGETTQLVVAGGLTIILPDAPVDLVADMRVSVYGWSISDASNGAPVFDWINIDEQFDYSSMEEPYHDDMGPFGAKEITIDSITLIYQVHFNQEMYQSSMPYPGGGETFVPTWQFSGTTDSGATLEFWVPAVDLSDTGK